MTQYLTIYNVLNGKWYMALLYVYIHVHVHLTTYMYVCYLACCVRVSSVPLAFHLRCIHVYFSALPSACCIERKYPYMWMKQD